jgi:hypothetical protein
MSERVRPALLHAANQREGARGTLQGPALMFNPENWYFAK